jgi:hypothetical protein
MDWVRDSYSRLVSGGQKIRCYTPADLSLLVAGTGLTLDRIIVGEESLEILSQLSDVLRNVLAWKPAARRDAAALGSW